MNSGSEAMESGRSSMESSENNTKNNKNRKSRRRTAGGDQKGDKMSSGGNAAGSGGSLAWTILFIGLGFSLINVVYIMTFVERQDTMMRNSLQQQGTTSIEQQVAVVATRNQKEDNDTNLKIDSPATPIKNPALVHSVEKPKGELVHPNNVNDNNDKESLLLLHDKEPILALIKEAGVKVDMEEDKDLLKDLPTWSEVVHMYGAEPVIHGLDRCEEFQTHSDAADHFVGVAGTFNSGTNLLAELLIANCHMQARMDKYGSVNRGIRWQVPWGKHTPVDDEEFRTSHKTEKDHNIDANDILPAVTIRDPMIWLKSMCRHHYAAHWDGQKNEDHCPDFGMGNNLGTMVRYAEFTRHHDSILHLWNDWYQHYLTAPFPKLLVRFEDLVFHPKETTKAVCECAGGTFARKFKYVVDSAKKGDGAHGKTRTGYVDAIVKYGSETRRYESYQHQHDLEYIQQHLDPQLMDLMKYPPVETDEWKDVLQQKNLEIL